MELIQTIRAKIERLIEESDFDESANLYSLLSFLSDLEESEKPMNHEALDKEIAAYFKDWYVDESDQGYSLKTPTGSAVMGHMKNVARHFAQWGAEHRGSSETPNDLKEAVKNYIYKAADSPGDDWTTDDIRKAYIAGYKLHEANTPLPEDTVLFNKGVEEGKRLMMEDAVEGEFQNTPFPTICLDDCKDFDFKDGDKVRIIILKEEKQ